MIDVPADHHSFAAVQTLAVKGAPISLDSLEFEPETSSRPTRGGIGAATASLGERAPTEPRGSSSSSTLARSTFGHDGRRPLRPLGASRPRHRRRRGDRWGDSAALAAAGARVALLGPLGDGRADGSVDRRNRDSRRPLRAGRSGTRLFRAVAALGGIDILVASHGTIASMLSFQGGLLAAAHATSRGVAQLTKALANEWAPLGVNVNAIASSTLPAARGSQSNPEVQCPTSFLSRSPRMPTEARSVLPDETPRRRRASTPVRWGAATHDFAEGVHRPLTITVLALQASPDDPVRLIAAVDIAMLGDLGDRSDSERILAPVREALGLTDGRLLVNCSHTHSSPWAATSRSNMPGGHLIGPYLDQLGQALLEAGIEAAANVSPATLTWATGACDLAGEPRSHRPGPGRGSRHLRLQPRWSCRRHPRSRAGDARRGRQHDGNTYQLRLPSDDPRVGQQADLTGLHRGDARASWSNTRPALSACSSTEPPAGGRPTSTSATPRWPTDTGAALASPRSLLSRECCHPARLCGTREWPNPARHSPSGCRPRSRRRRYWPARASRCQCR